MKRFARDPKGVLKVVDHPLDCQPHLRLQGGNSGAANVGGEEEEVALGEVDLAVKLHQVLVVSKEDLEKRDEISRMAAHWSQHLQGFRLTRVIVRNVSSSC